LQRRLELSRTEGERDTNRMLEVMESMHQQTVKDKQTIRAQRAELKLLRGDGADKISTVDKPDLVKASVREVNKENRSEEAGQAEPARTAEKRKYGDVFNDSVGEFNVDICH